MNLPFFLPSTAFFSNYTVSTDPYGLLSHPLTYHQWPSPFPAMTAQYFLGLDQKHYPRAKQLKDLYIGVDVWGRGSHGGGGFGIYRAISHIDPESLGLSVALFGCAWSWESEQDKPGWSWKTWWEYERKLWLGPEKLGEHVPVPELKLREDEPACEHGSFKPIADFFPNTPPPNPAHLPFFTTFSPGVGWAWFVRGAEVLHSETGWTDLSKTTSIGDLVFPRPTLAWENGERDEAVPQATSKLLVEDAWLGGSSLVVTVSASGSEAEDAFFRCVWLPIQSLAITPRKPYRMSIVYKVDGPVDTDVGAAVKSLSKEHGGTEFDVSAISEASLPHGWSELSLDFTLPLPAGTDIDILTVAGLVIGFTCEDPSQQVEFSIHVGLLSVSANSPSSAHTTLSPRIIWVDFAATELKSEKPFAGTLTWDTGTSLGPVPVLSITSPEDTRPAWILDHPPPRFAWFNVYALPRTGEGSGMPPEEAVFVGTTGYDGRANRFYVDPACIPDELKGAAGARFFVQGVTDKGKVLDWEDCAFVDVSA